MARRQSDIYVEMYREWFELWTDLNPEEVKGIEGVIRIEDYRSTYGHLAVYIDPRYSMDDIISEVKALASLKKE